MGLRATDPETPLSRLFPLERVLDAADSVLDLSCRLVGLALGLQLGIAKHLAGDLLGHLEKIPLSRGLQIRFKNLLNLTTGSG